MKLASLIPKLGSGRKLIQKSEMRDLDITVVSLVENPANQKSLVIKSKDGQQFKNCRTATISKVRKDGKQGRLYVTVYEPDTKDAHGDHATAEEIQKACDNFSENGRMQNVDVNHNFQKEEDFFIAENYVLKTADKENFPNTKLKSWVQVIKCKNLENPTWEKVEKGLIKGVSMYGSAGFVNDNSATIEKMNSTIETLKNLVSKSEGQNVDAIKDEIKNLEAKITQLEGQNQDDNIQKSLKTIEKSFETLAEKLNTVVSKSLNGDPEDNMNGDRTVIGPAGETLVIKASRKEVRKALKDLTFGDNMDFFKPTDIRLFLDTIINYGADETLKDITILPIHKDGKIDVGLLQDIILVNELDGDPDEQLIATGDKTMIPQVVKAHVALKRETVEFYKDNYGEDAYLAYIDEKITEGIHHAVGALVFSGDRASSDSEIKAIDGIVKRATTASDVTALSVSDPTDPDFKTIFKKALKSFPKKMLRKKKDFVFYVSDYTLLDIQSYYADRKTAVGDGFLLKDEKVWFNGIPVKARYMPDDAIVAGLSRAIILGYITDMEMDKGKKLGEWKVHWYTRAKFDIGYIAGNIKVFKIENAPYATNVNITGTAQVGQVLTGNYTFNDVNDDTESGTSFRWLSCSTPDGTYGAISGATSSTLTIAEAQEDEYIKFEVTPRSSAGKLDGTPVVSERTGIVIAAS